MRYTLLAFALSALLLSAPALAQVPQLPFTLKGGALLNGEPAPAGTPVSAVLEGREIASSETFGNGEYVLSIDASGLLDDQAVMLLVAGIDSGVRVNPVSGGVESADLSVSSWQGLWGWAWLAAALAAVGVAAAALGLGRRRRKGTAGRKTGGGAEG
jgi:hypothetical protein